MRPLKDSVEGNHLNLSNQAIHDNDVITICEFLDQNPQINSVDLSDNWISEGIVDLAKVKTINSLNLCLNRLHYSSHTAMLALAENTTLTVLDLSRTYEKLITTDGFCNSLIR